MLVEYPWAVVVDDCHGVAIVEKHCLSYAQFSFSLGSVVIEVNSASSLFRL